VPVFDRLYRETEKANPHASEKLIFNAVIRKIFDRMVSDLVENTGRRVREAGVKTLDDLRKFPKRLAAFSDAVENERAQTKGFLYQNLYFSEALEPEKDVAERVITELFEHWVANPEALPASYQEKAKREPLPRVVCDYIAGMTDNFILDQHEKMITRNASTSG
jgi:dGTPase